MMLNYQSQIFLYACVKRIHLLLFLPHKIFLSSLADMEICALTLMMSIQATSFRGCLLFNSSVTVNVAKRRGSSLEQMHYELDLTIL